jgi:hypothetical protein
VAQKLAAWQRKAVVAIDNIALKAAASAWRSWRFRENQKIIIRYRNAAWRIEKASIMAISEIISINEKQYRGMASGEMASARQHHGEMARSVSAA